MRKYTMHDRSTNYIDGAPIHHEPDRDLTLLQVFNMTDYTDEEIDHIANMVVGEEYFKGSDSEIYIRRDA